MQGFTFWNRRHHCRKCNLLVCGDHSKNRNDANQRVCDVCSRAALKAETDEIALEYYQGIFKKLPLNPRTIIVRALYVDIVWCSFFTLSLVVTSLRVL